MLNQLSLNANLQINKLTDPNALWDLKTDWERVYKCSHTHSVFRLWDWSFLWWKHYHHLGELFIVTVSINGIIEGIAPFYRKKGKFLKYLSITELYFIGTGGDTSPDDLDIICNPNYAETIVDAICIYLLDDRSIDRYQFIDLRSDSLFPKRFISLAEQYSLPSIQKQQSTRKVMSLPSTYPAYLSLLSRNTRKRIKNRNNKLKSEKNIRFMRCKSIEEIDYGYSHLIKLHHARRATIGPSDSFTSQAYLAFHRELMHMLAPRGEVYLLVMLQEDKAIGVEYAFYTGNVLSFFQTGFDPDYQWLSPGHIMMNYMIQDVIEHGAAGIDLLKGDYPYKNSYAKEDRLSVTLCLWRNHIIANVKRCLATVRKLLNATLHQ